MSHPPTSPLSEPDHITARAWAETTCKMPIGYNDANLAQAYLHHCERIAELESELASERGLFANLAVSAAELAREKAAQHTLIERIKGALQTGEDGENLVAVAHDVLDYIDHFYPIPTTKP